MEGRIGYGGLEGGTRNGREVQAGVRAKYKMRR